VKDDEKDHNDLKKNLFNMIITIMLLYAWESRHLMSPQL